MNNGPMDGDELTLDPRRKYVVNPPPRLSPRERRRTWTVLLWMLRSVVVLPILPAAYLLSLSALSEYWEFVDGPAEGEAAMSVQLFRVLGCASGFILVVTIGILLGLCPMSRGGPIAFARRRYAAVIIGAIVVLGGAFLWGFIHFNH